MAINLRIAALSTISYQNAYLTRAVKFAVIGNEPDFRNLMATSLFGGNVFLPTREGDTGRLDKTDYIFGCYEARTMATTADIVARVKEAGSGIEYPLYYVDCSNVGKVKKLAVPTVYVCTVGDDAVIRNVDADKALTIDPDQPEGFLCYTAEETAEKIATIMQAVYLDAVNILQTEENERKQKLDKANEIRQKILKSQETATFEQKPLTADGWWDSLSYAEKASLWHK